jgi:hypothetical protein
VEVCDCQRLDQCGPLLAAHTLRSVDHPNSGMYRFLISMPAQHRLAVRGLISYHMRFPYIHKYAVHAREVECYKFCKWTPFAFQHHSITSVQSDTVQVLSANHPAICYDQVCIHQAAQFVGLWISHVTRIAPSVRTSQSAAGPDRRCQRLRERMAQLRSRELRTESTTLLQRIVDRSAGCSCHLAAN